jgi:DNA gyrase/topoisomerase IV subunit A
MSWHKQQRRIASHHQEAVQELEGILKGIERSEELITSLRIEMDEVNEKYPAQRTTQQDIDFLTDLLSCAKKKLLLEKQIETLKKRVPAALERVSNVIGDRKAPPSAEMQTELLDMLKNVQHAMEHLDSLVR